MKATGIVRRIDNLGRVVIPKEIRKTMRIHTGDPLEIYLDRNGKVIFKKYALHNKLEQYAREYVKSLHETLGHVALITDNKEIISAAGRIPKNVARGMVGQTVINTMESRSMKVHHDPVNISEEGGQIFTSSVICPITVDGEVMGSVIVASTKEDSPVGEVEAKITQTAAEFLAKQMNENSAERHYQGPAQ
ncbi:MAG: stage V sporulation T C-terminal domain-containing protein [Bacillota bacterium]